MDFYTPLFSKVVDSSLWDEPDYVIKVFLTMIAKKDRDQVCRGNAYNVAQWSRKTEKEVLAAFKILSEPDRKRIEPQPFDGRRIEKVVDGWLILNGKFYQDLMGTVNRRAQKARYEKNRRERKKDGDSKIPKSQDRPPSGKYLAGQSRHEAAINDGNIELADKIAAGEA